MIEYNKQNDGLDALFGFSKLPQTLSPQKEQEILMRVRPLFLQASQGKARPSTSAPSSPWLGWIWGTSATAATAFVALLVWFSLPSPHTKPSWQVVGVQPTAGSHTIDPLHPLRFRSGAQTGHIQDGKRWKIQLGQHTHLALSKSTKANQYVALQRGSIFVDVTPRTMKKFAVQVQQYRVEVRGTSFGIEREATWIRVEVWHGKVALLSPQTSERMIPAGNGCRMALPQGAPQCYALPPLSHKALPKRLRWLAAHHPKMLFTYISDLAHNRRIPQRKRIRLLRDAFELLQQTKQLQHAIRVALWLAKLAIDGNEAILVEAASLCHRISRTNAAQQTTPLLCQTVCQQCLRQCKDPIWREQSLSVLANLSFFQAKTEPQFTKAIAIIHQYLRLYPSGSWQKELRRLLVRHAISQKVSCKRAKKLLAPGDLGENWFVKHCGR